MIGVQHVAFTVRQREQLIDGALEPRGVAREVGDPERAVAEGVERDVPAATAG